MNPRSRHALPVHDMTVNTLDWMDGTLVTGGDDYKLKLWRSDNCEVIENILVEEKAI
jgi:hypothetical protein